MDKITDNAETYPDEFIDLGKLYSALLDYKLFIISLTLSATILTIIYAITLPNIYKSEALLEVANSNSGSSLSSSLSQYSGIASMAGISLPGGESGDKGNLAIEIIKSRDFLEHLVSFDGMLESLMASKSYDFESKKIIYDKNLYDHKKSKWVRPITKKKNSMPSALEAHKLYIDKSLNISRDKTSGFISLSINHVSPEFAYRFLNMIILEANEIARTDALNNSTKAIDYLNKAAANTQVQEIRKSINTLVESQLETQMLASINDEFLLKIIDAPYIPEEKSDPQRILIIVLGFLGSFLASISIAVIRFYALNK